MTADGHLRKPHFYYGILFNIIIMIIFAIVVALCHACTCIFWIFSFCVVIGAAFVFNLCCFCKHHGAGEGVTLMGIICCALLKEYYLCVCWFLLQMASIADTNRILLEDEAFYGKVMMH